MTTNLTTTALFSMILTSARGLTTTALLIVSLLSCVTAAHAEDELRFGLLAHATGPVSSGIETGMDLNLEWRMNRNPNLHALFGRGALGTSLNNHGGTSQIYLGRSWQSELSRAVEFEYFFGLSIHNGRLDGHDKDHRLLGSRIVVRQAFELGYHLPTFRISVIYTHASHLGLLASRNQGLDNFGIRLSFPF